MRILHVTPFYEPFWAYGGMARASASLCRALAARGHEVTVATALLDDGVPPEAVEGGVRVRRFRGPKTLARLLFPVAPGFRAFLRGEWRSFDVAHLQGHRNGLAVTAARVLSSAGRPWLLTPAGTFPHHGQHSLVKTIFDRLMGDRIVKGARALVAVSESEARDLPRPARVIPNGVDACGSVRVARASHSRPRLLFVGSDRPQKRGYVLPQVLARLPEVDLELVGPLGSRFRRRFDAFGRRVSARGVLSGADLAAAYADADVLVHPAVGEAFGLVPFEAALAGTAAVVAGGHGCGEWYGRAGGCVVPPDDVEALREAVRRRLQDRDLGREEARRVAEFAQSRLTWSAAAAAFESVYEELRERVGPSSVGEAPAVTAIVLNYNGRGFVMEAVQSLLEQDGADVEVIVVDNASSDGSPEEIEAAFGKRVRLLRSPRNLGFGGGNNVGIRQARGRHIVLLNNDAVAAPSFARELVAAAESHETVGMVAAKVLDYSRWNVIDTVGHLLYADGLNRGRGRLEEDRGQYDDCATALFPSGAAALYSRRMLDDVGLFDESFFLYGDDAELGLRGRVAGWACALAPRAVAYHHYSRSVGAYSSLKAFYVERNRVLVLFKLFPLRLILASPVSTIARLALQSWGALTGRGAAGRLAAETTILHLVGLTLRAYVSALRELPRILGERWRSRRRRRLSAREFVALLREFRLSATEAALKD